MPSTNGRTVREMAAYVLADAPYRFQADHRSRSRSYDDEQPPFVNTALEQWLADPL